MNFFDNVIEKVQDKIGAIIAKDVDELLNSNEQLKDISKALDGAIPELMAPSITKEALPQLKQTIAHVFKVGLLVGSEVFVSSMEEAAEEIKE